MLASGPGQEQGVKVLGPTVVPCQLASKLWGIQIRILELKKRILRFSRETITMHECKEFITLRKDPAQQMQIWIFRIRDPRNRKKYTNRFSCGKKKRLGRSRGIGLFLKDLWPCLCGHELF